MLEKHRDLAIILTMAKILVVDDCRFTVQIISKILENNGFEVIKAFNGNEALAQFKQHEFDLLLTDLNMPELNGVELITHLRGIDKYQALHIVMLTTETREEVNKTLPCPVAADDWIVKPINSAKILDSVKGFLSAP